MENKNIFVLPMRNTLLGILGLFMVSISTIMPIHADESPSDKSASNTTKTIDFHAEQSYGVIGITAKKHIDNPSDNFFTVDLGTEVTSTDTFWLAYELKGVNSFSGVSRQINDQLSVGGMIVTNSKDWSSQKEALPQGLLKKGKNTIQFNLPQDAQYGYEIKNLRILKSATQEKRKQIQVLEVAALNGTSQIYVRGFIQDAHAQLEIEGNKVFTNAYGEFETLVNASQDLNLELTNKNGGVYADNIALKDVVITKKVDHFNALGSVSESESFRFSRNTKGVFTAKNVVLEVNEGALLKLNQRISVTPLRSVDRIALDFGMTNTSKGEGYRFLPHGIHFQEKGALVKIKYDRTKIPSGYTENDIRTYYFDTNTRHWVALERKSIDKKNQYIVSETTHFTDMINGVIKTPESPESTGYSPTTISGIKAADPSSKVNLIQPPSANATGTANVSYPIEVPPGRQGMQPSPTIQYNSDGGESWLGHGWDLSVPSISVETRWGVPVYDGSTETETYNLMGAMLSGVHNGKTFVAHKGEEVPRASNRQFYKRIAGSFERIIRKGNSPQNYTWEVTDKSGTTHYYGGVGSVDNNAVLKDPATGNIAKWCLVETRDVHGNFIRYKHQVVSTPVFGGNLSAQIIYCTETTYTGFNNREGDYKVTYERISGTANRKDRRTNANYGFLVMNSDDLLKRIEVTYDGQPVRSYELEYKEGAFFKTLLDKITQFDAAGNVFNEHTLEYYDDVDATGGYIPFKSVENWNTSATGEGTIRGGLINPLKATNAFSDKIPATGGGQTKSFGGSVYVGVGPLKPGILKGGAGGSFGYSRSTSEGKISMIDINGDGLPDKVVDTGGNLYYLPNLAKASVDGSVMFGERTPIIGASDFSKTVSNSFNGGFKAYVGGITRGRDFSKGRTKTSTYFADVNSDGLIDIVQNSRVLFNHIDPATGVVRFTATSAGTPSPINGGGVIDVSDTAIDPAEQQEEIDNSPLHDIIRVWRAPFDGTVTIQAPVQLIAPTGDFDTAAYELSDGVHVTIQRNTSELWTSSIQKGDFGVKNPTGVGSLSVDKGDLIYFRVQSGKEDISNGDFDKVNWDPNITYTNFPQTINYNGTSLYSYKASESSLFCESGALPIPPNASTANILGTFEKPITTDDVVLKITDITSSTVLLEKLYRWDAVVNESVVVNNIAFSTNPENLTQIAFELSSKTQIDWQALKWQPRIEVATSITSGGETVSVDDTLYGIVGKNVLTKNVFTGSSYTVSDVNAVAVEVIPSINVNSFTLSSQLESINQDTRVYAAVKQNNKLIQRYELSFGRDPITNTYRLFGYTPTIIEELKYNDTFWVEYSIPNDALANVIISNRTAIREKRLVEIDGEGFFQDIALQPSFANSAIYTKENDIRFGSLYQNWGQFGYNAMEGRANRPIDKNLLRLPENENDQPDPKTQVFIVMSPDAEKARWDGYDPETFIEGQVISASRLGLKHVVLTNELAGIDTNIAQTSGGTGAFGIVKEVVNESTTDMSGALILNISDSRGSSRTKTDFRDMNGDGYPDIITENMIQYTNSRGGFSGRKINISGIHRSTNNSESFGAGGSPVRSKSPNSSGSGDSNKSESGNKANDQAKNNGSVSVSASASFNNDETNMTYQDVNGDGLADRVNGNRVAINVGYGFLPEVTMTNSFALVTKGSSDSQNAGLGFDLGGSSFSGGIGVNRGDNTMAVSLMDVNSDGLPDKVRKDGSTILVSLNTGQGFEGEQVWNGIDEINKSSSTGESINAAFNIPIKIPFFGIEISINPGVNAGKSANRNLTMLNDVDGDGYIDFVESDEDGSMSVRRSAIRNTNRLRSVQNPMGGSFEIGYERSEATYDHPRGKWVMESVVMKDGIADDGPDMKTMFVYEDGKFDRHERAFLGFGKVITESIDTENGGNTSTEVYRLAEQKFDVSTYYKQGNLLVSELKDAQGNVFTKNENEYFDYSLVPSNDQYTRVSSLDRESGIAFHPMKYTKLSSFEGGTSGVTLQESSYEYGNFGEVANYKYTDKGNLKSSNFSDFNYRTIIGYKDDISNYIISLPDEVRVTGNGGSLFRKTEANYDSRGNMTKVETTLNTANEKSVVDLTYDKYGNITKRTMPANHKGERMFYEYRYEGTLHQYVERIEDVFGYHTRFEEYDYRFGQLLESEDINGFFINYEIDDVGRITKITGPKEHEKGIDYTIKFSYFPNAQVDGNRNITRASYAITEHYDPQHEGDNLETVTFMDGAARAIQVKKEGVITNPSTESGTPPSEEVYIVSGRTKYDAFGRATENYYPTTEPKGSAGVFNATFDNITPTTTVYDVQDRAITTTLPDGASTQMDYDVDQGLNSLKTKVTDAEGNKKTSFTNGSSLVLRVEEEQEIVTNYQYDAINQLTKVIDVDNNEIVSTYDIAGRRTSILHPDAGLTALEYDTASNMVSKETANLHDAGSKITYEYDFNRLHKILYPEHPDNNVTYHYGNRNASHNRVGRLTAQEDATGAQEFFYGNLGEITKTIRTVIIPNNAIATFETEWKYDTWNRLEEMIYPDQEKITYKYNKGGLLDQVIGSKARTYNYVKKLGYDKFEQRTYMQYCNGAETFYNYEPDRRRLSNLVAFTGEGLNGGNTDIRKFMDNVYDYDKVNNVLSVNNNAPLPNSDKPMGGQMQHSYSYDNLYRLTGASGTYTGVDGRAAQYSLAMTYDKLHNITSKEQHIEQTGVTFDGKLSAGYKLDYTYGDNPHQIAVLRDKNYRTEEDDPRKYKETDNAYEYDLNGNLVFISKNTVATDEKQEGKRNERKLLWDEENRLEAVNDNGFVSLYTYDGSGERVTKMSSAGGAAFVNAAEAGGYTQTNKYTTYVNPYFVLSSGGQYTKHIMINGQRIVSKLGDVNSFGEDPRRIEYAGDTEGIKIEYEDKYTQSQQVIRDRYEQFGVEYRGEDNNDFKGGESFCCGNQSSASRSAGKSLNNSSVGPVKEPKEPGITDGEDPELYQYYYHADHLGSASYLTNLDGEIAQHVEYVPFGEVFLEERNNKWNSPYLFNGKELDEETGLSYYGARYYNPRVSNWLSVDPIALYDPVLQSEHYINGEHNKGYFNPRNTSVYGYTYQNPIRYVDPNGKQADVVKKLEERGHDPSKCLRCKSSPLRKFGIEEGVFVWGNSKRSDVLKGNGAKKNGGSVDVKDIPTPSGIKGKNILVKWFRTTFKKIQNMMKLDAQVQKNKQNRAGAVGDDQVDTVNMNIVGEDSKVKVNEMENGNTSYSVEEKDTTALKRDKAKVNMLSKERRTAKLDSALNARNK